LEADEDDLDRFGEILEAEALAGLGWIKLAFVAGGWRWAGSWVG
jgi:hypothetical protein